MTSQTKTATGQFFVPCPSICRVLVLRALSRMTRGHLKMHLPDGRTRSFGNDTHVAAAVIRVHHENFFHRCVFAGDIGFAEGYLSGDWDTPDLTAVIAWFIQNHENAPTLSGSQRQGLFSGNVFALANRLRHLLRPNSRKIARRNISDHYDLSNDFFALMLGQAAGIRTEVVGYRGSASLISDLVGGHLPMAVDSLDTVVAQHDAGKLRILATSGAKRSVPSIPTFREAGLPITATGWNVVFAKPTMPAALAERIATELRVLMGQADVREKFQTAGAEPVVASQAETREMLRRFRAQ